MTRRRPDDDSSLELLLDTICNVFGGILFMAILVSLLASNRATEAVSEADRVKESIELRGQMRELLAARAALVQAMKHNDQTLELLESENGRASVDEALALSAQQEQLHKATTEIREWLDAYEKVKAQSAAELERQAKEAEAAVAAAKAELKQHQKRTSVEGRLPMERETSKGQVLVYLTGNRIHFIAVGRGMQLVEHAGMGDHAAVMPAGAGSFEVRPDPARGIVAGADLSQHAGFQQLLAQAGPRTMMFDMFLQPDSVQAFASLRRAIVAAGYEYNVHPMDGRPLRLHVATSINVQ